MKTYTNFTDHSLKVNTEDFNVLVVIDPSGTPIRLSLKDVTYSTNTYEGLISKITPLTLATDSNLQNLINQQSLDITLAADNAPDPGDQYKDILESDLINLEVNVSIILGSAQDNYTFGDFYIYDYTLGYGELTIRIKSIQSEEYEKEVLSDQQILHFGDFGNNLDSAKELIWEHQGWQYHSNRLAKAIKVGERKYLLCNKQMEAVPSDQDEFDMGFYAHRYSVLYHRHFWVKIALDYTANSITNNQGGCIIEVVDSSTTFPGYFDENANQRICIHPQPYSGHYSAGSNNLLDGNEDTSVTATTSRVCYHFDSDDIAAIKDGMGKASINLEGWHLVVDFGVIPTGATVVFEVRDKATNSSVEYIIFDDTYSNLDGSYNFMGNIGAGTDEDIDLLADYFFTLQRGGSGSDPAVNNIIFGLEINTSLSSDPSSARTLLIEDVEELYVRCEGVEYDDDWNSRVTPGDLIEQPVRILEYLLRYIGVPEAKIDMDTFDTINTICSFEVTYTIQGVILFNTILKDFSRTMGINLLHRILNTNTFYPILYGDGLTYPNSGTSSPGDRDTFEDALTVSDGEYTENPILKESVKITAKKSTGQIVVNYSKVASSTYLDSSSSGSGSLKEITSDFFSSEGEFDNADNAINILNRYTEERRLIDFKSFINAFVFEPGDAIAFEHGIFLAHFDLESIKAVIYFWAFDFMTQLVTIKASEVSNTS